MRITNHGDHYRRFSTQLALFYGRTVSFLLRMSIPPFIPFLMVEFGWNAFEIGLLASAYLWSYAFAQIPWGIAVDRWGARKSLILGWIIMIGSSLVFVLSSTLEQLACARLLFGIGAASILVASTVIVTEVSSRSERGRAMGLISSSSSIGTLFAGISVPWLLASNMHLLALETWRTAFVVITIPAVFALLSLSWVPSTSYAQHVSAKNSESQTARSHVRHLIRDWRLYSMSVAMSGYIVGFTLSSTWIYAYFENEYKLPATFVTTIASLAIFGSAIPGSLLSGWLSDRLGKRAKVSTMGAFIAAASMLMLVFKMPLICAVFVLILYGTFSLFHTPIFAMPAETWSLEISGTALSIIIGIAQIGAALAPVASGYLLDTTSKYELIWLFSTGIYLSAALSLIMTREKRYPGKDVVSRSRPTTRAFLAAVNTGWSYLFGNVRDKSD